MVLGIILLVVTVVCVVSVLRQLKFKNYFALGFSGIAALSFGFFSIMTIFCEIAINATICNL